MNKGSIKVSVLYPAGKGKHFDMDYYCNTHIPMVTKLMGDALKSASVEKGLGGAGLGTPAAYACMGNMYFDTMEEFQNAFGPNAAEIMADAPNYTNSEPIIQVSEVMM